MPLASGSEFAGFTIVDLLGAGGMGEVYLVEHPRLPRREALKILPAEVSADAEFRARFTREADLAAALWHPHIVGVHDRGECDGQLWISMDYVDGTDAGRLLGKKFPAGMPPDNALAIVVAIAEALDYAHEHDLLHRDVKPANILLTQPSTGTGRIILADFGIARRVDDVSGLTATNMTVGTITYAAPEQLTGRPLDARADQYSLAATAYRLLCGAPPFAHSNPAAVIGCHLNSPPPRLRDARPDLGSLDAAISRAMSKQPGDRYERCQDFAAALRSSWEPQRDTAGTVMWGPGLETERASPGPANVMAAPLPPPVHGSTGRSHSNGKDVAIVAGALGVVAIVATILIGLVLVTKHYHSASSVSEQQPYLSSTVQPWTPSTTTTQPSLPTVESSQPPPIPPGPQPYWDGIWLRDYWESPGDCDSPHTYWVVQPGDNGLAQLKIGCFPQTWIDNLNNKGHALSWWKAVIFAVWDPARIMTEYNKHGDLQMIGLDRSCLARAGITEFHEGPIHDDCLIKPSLRS